jgi:hypothetical protein
MGRKGVIFGGFGREKRGQKGVFLAPEAGKRALFCVPEGWMAGAEGFSGQNRTLCQRQRPAQIHPPIFAPGEKAESPCFRRPRPHPLVPAQVARRKQLSLSFLLRREQQGPRAGCPTIRWWRSELAVCAFGTYYGNDWRPEAALQSCSARPGGYCWVIPLPSSCLKL